MCTLDFTRIIISETKMIQILKNQGIFSHESELIENEEVFISKIIQLVDLKN